MGFGEAVASCLRHYLGFGGRAPRSEFWWFQLCWLLAIGGAIALGIDHSDTHPSGLTGGYPAKGLFLLYLALQPPQLAVCSRRLHDIGLPGWYMLLNLAPLGMLAFVILVLCRGNSGWNAYGPDPLERPTHLHLDLHLHVPRY